MSVGPFDSGVQAVGSVEEIKADKKKTAPGHEERDAVTRPLINRQNETFEQTVITNQLLGNPDNFTGRRMGHRRS